MSRYVPISPCAAAAVLAVTAVLPPGCGDSPSRPSAAGLAISAAQPNSAPSGAEVRLVGAGFQGGTTVTFGDVAASVTAVFNSQVVVTAPDHAAGTADIVVTNPGGARATLFRGFTFVPFEIARVQPSEGFPGLHFFVFGSGFLPGARVTVDGMMAGAFGTSTTSISAYAPEHAVGRADVVVTNPGGRSAALSGGFTYHPLPVLTVAPTVVAPGGQLSVSYVVSLTSGLDWIGLYRVDADNHSFLTFQYIRGLSGTVNFTAPSQPGQYEFRYLPLDAYDVFARTQVVTVTAPNPFEVVYSLAHVWLTSPGQRRGRSSTR